MANIQYVENIKAYSYFIYDFILDNKSSLTLLLSMSYSKKQIIDTIYITIVKHISSNNELPNLKTAIFSVFKNLMISTFTTGGLNIDDYNIIGIDEFGLVIKLYNKDNKFINDCLNFYLLDLDYGLIKK